MSHKPQILTEGSLDSLPQRQHGSLLAGVLPNLVGELTPGQLVEIESMVQWRHLRGGEILCRQGDPGDALYPVLDGRLRVVAELDDGTPRIVGEIGRGEFVGEYALLTGEPRTATVYAIRDTNVGQISRQAFEEMVKKYPQVLRHITRLTILRALEALRGVPVGETPSVFALVPASPGVPLAEFASRLAETLQLLGPTLHLDSTSVRRLSDTESAGSRDDADLISANLTGWLSAQEAKYRFIIYEADMEWTSWTALCTRQADRVLILGQPGSNPEPGETEVEMNRERGPREVKPCVELVLVHSPDAANPTGTRRWLSRRSVVAHHHVRWGVSGDMRALARRLTGRAIALILGGGGARGYAHIGVIRAMEEAGLEIDMVGGTSMGALMGACYAIGMSPARIRVSATQFGKPRRLFDPTIPLVSFFSSKN